MEAKAKGGVHAKEGGDIYFINQTGEARQNRKGAGACIIKNDQGEAACTNEMPANVGEKMPTPLGIQTYLEGEGKRKEKRARPYLTRD